MANKDRDYKASSIRQMLRLPSLLMLLLLIITAGAAGVAAQAIDGNKGTLKGTISAVGANAQTYNVPGAGLKLNGTSPPMSVVSDDTGEYKFADVAPGVYTLEISLEGFKPTSRNVTIRAGETTIENISLELAVVTGVVNVVGASDGVNTKDAAPPAELKQKTLQNVPLINERFQDALPLIPGVVRGPDGQINVKGSRASESGLTVNSANVTDPVTGEFAINLPIEAIQSVQVLTNPYAPEYGRFTGAVTAIETRSGSDKFDFQLQSFFPRPRRRGGKFAGIEAFTPRLTFSGPIKKHKLWFIQSFEYRFVRSPVKPLPPLKRDTGLESFDSVTQLDWDINPNNHLTTTFSLFPQKLRFVGLNTFNPQEVTPNFKQRGFFWAINERKVLSSRAVLESYFSVKKFDADVFPSSGNAPMNFAPDVNSGNFFNRQERRSKRYEWLEVYSFNLPNFAGSHFMKIGVGLSYSTFDGHNTSNMVRILRADGRRSQQIDFVGGGALNRNKTEFLSYFQDKWSVNKRLTLEYGVRYDRDNIAHENNFAPRIAFAFLPVLNGRTVIRGGIGLFYDKIDLNTATFPQLQEREITRFGSDGQQIVGLPQRQHFLLENGKFRTPRSVNWNIELDREWVKNFFVRVGYQQREGQREYVLNPLETPSGNILLLNNGGSSRYREFQITARYKFREHDEFVASYVRSSANGDLNDFNSYFGNFENPIIRANEGSRLPWDAPNRFLFWGQFTAKYGITVAPVLDIRNGFPLSIIDQDRNFVGARNRAGHFPTFYSLDLQVMKDVSLPGRWGENYRARLGLKGFNLTNHFNPRDFQGNLASANFGGFSNGVGRRYGLKFVIEKK